MTDWWALNPRTFGSRGKCFIHWATLLSLILYDQECMAMCNVAQLLQNKWCAHDSISARDSIMRQHEWLWIRKANQEVLNLIGTCIYLHDWYYGSLANLFYMHHGLPHTQAFGICVLNIVTCLTMDRIIISPIGFPNLLLHLTRGKLQQCILLINSDLYHNIP